MPGREHVGAHPNPGTREPTVAGVSGEGKLCRVPPGPAVPDAEGREASHGEDRGVSRRTGGGTPAGCGAGAPSAVSAPRREGGGGVRVRAGDAGIYAVGAAGER